MKFYFLFSLCAALIACTNSEEKTNAKQGETVDQNKLISAEPVYKIHITEVAASAYGYQILQNGKVMIDQKNIPAIQGNVAFSSREDAESVANVVLQKIKNGVFPPTISLEELKELGVLNERL